MEKREFRTRESYEAELVTRNMLPNFLRSKGFNDVRDDRGPSGMGKQIIHATGPDGQRLTMRVKLCWRRRDDKRRFAAQLLAKVEKPDWEGSLQHFVDLARADGVTHFLFIQREPEIITAAALVPVSDLVEIWCAQRDRSNALIAKGKLGKRHKNHAMNGSSPTLWLEDDSAPEVTDALWKRPGVANLVEMELVAADGLAESVDDTLDDMPGIDFSLIGSDGAPRTFAVRSLVKRDQRVRGVVLERAEGNCERCGATRDYPGFFDVHHILGAETSDRVWNCVALCPNCHREAHLSPKRQEINASLLNLALKFKVSA